MPETITFHCQNCGHRITTGIKNIGKKGSCHGCQAMIIIPNLSTGITFDPGSTAKGRGFCVASLIFGILSLLVFAFHSAAVGIACGVIGLIMGQSDGNRKFAIAGIGLSLIGAMAQLYWETLTM